MPIAYCRLFALIHYLGENYNIHHSYSITLIMNYF